MLPVFVTASFLRHFCAKYKNTGIYIFVHLILKFALLKDGIPILTRWRGSANLALFYKSKKYLLRGSRI
jgi:hypothetical protein